VSVPLIAAQLFIAVAMVDVWLLRYDKPLRARGGDAQTMREEFRVYGLPDWFRGLIRVLKLGSAALLVVGIWHPASALVGGLALVFLMAGAIAMHVKVRDPLYKALPATLFFLLSCYVTWANWVTVAG
jgi:hypothetical protein